MTPNRSTLPASSLRRVLIALVTFTLLAVSLSAPVLGAKGGNSAASAACENGGYVNWTTATGAAFKNEGACVKYAAQGGVLQPVVTWTLDAGLYFQGGTVLQAYHVFGTGWTPNTLMSFTVTGAHSYDLATVTTDGSGAFESGTDPTNDPNRIHMLCPHAATTIHITADDGTHHAEIDFLTTAC